MSAASGAPQIAPRRILIVLLGAIGDVTRALPLLQRLRTAYPQAHITWAVEPASASLLRGHPWLDQVLVFERRLGASAYVRFLRQVRAAGADLSIDLQRHLKSGMVSFASGAPLRLGFHRVNAREGNWLFNTHHIAPQDHFSSKLEQFLRFGDWLGVPALPAAFGLELSAAEERRVEELLQGVERPFVAAFVGSSCDSRLWFPQRTAAVADELAARGIGCVLVGGPGDVDYAAAVRGAAQSTLHDLTGRTNLRELAGIFARCAAAYGPDSGPMHIAAAAGARVVSLWGATSAKRSAPWHNQLGVIEGSAPCMPCYRKSCPIGRVCMTAISVEQVVQRVQQSIGAGPQWFGPPASTVS